MKTATNKPNQENADKSAAIREKSSSQLPNISSPTLSSVTITATTTTTINTSNINTNNNFSFNNIRVKDLFYLISLVLLKKQKISNMFKFRNLNICTFVI